MSDDLPPYEGSNWLHLTDEELVHLVGIARGILRVSVEEKIQHLAGALRQRLVQRALLPQAEAIPSHVRTDRGGLEFPE
jgi:hypothetical protein